MSLKARLVAASIALCLPVVAYFEGTRYRVYLDPVGIPTVCTGHTGPDVKMGDVWTPAQCNAALERDLEEAAKSVDRCATGPMTKYQRAAFISFTFNVGPGKAGVKDGFCTLKSGKPSTMVRLINEGRAAEACDQFKYWKQPGQGLAGIAKRRDAEEALCKRSG